MISTAPLAPITAICAVGQRDHVAAQVLGRHDVIGAAERLASDDRDLGNRRLGIGEQQLRAVLDEAAIFLRRTGQKPGTSTKVMIGMLKQSQKRTKRAAFREASESRTPASANGLVGDNARPSFRHPSEAGHDVFGVRLLDLEEVTFVRNFQDQLLDVVGLVGIVRDQRVERDVDPVGIVEARQRGGCSRLEAGRKSISRRICKSASTSLS